MYLTYLHEKKSRCVLTPILLKLQVSYLFIFFDDDVIISPPKCQSLDQHVTIMFGYSSAKSEGIRFTS